MAPSDITLYYAPQSRATGTRVLLEELGAPYTLEVLDIRVSDYADHGFREVNPLAKVPTLKVGNTIITEQIAIGIYLGDRFADAGMAPSIDAPERGTYLRWMAYYAACFEPALMDKAAGHDPGPATQSVYGSYDEMLTVLAGALQPGPYFLGEQFSVLDVQWGVALQWTMMFGLVPETPLLRAYVDRVVSRPVAHRIFEEDARLAAEQAQARGEA